MIKLPNRFKSDLQLKNISLKPYVIIGSNEDIVNKNAVFLSGISQSKKIIIDGNEHIISFQGLILNVGSISNFVLQSNGKILDRKMSIRKLDINLSNFNINQSRFGDNVLDYYKKQIRIFYASNDDAYIDTEIVAQEDFSFRTGNEDERTIISDITENVMLLVFNGFVQEFDVESDIVKIIAEDNTSRFYNKSVPKKEDVISDDLQGFPVLTYDKGKTIPIVYGDTVRSPLLKVRKGRVDSLGVYGYVLIADKDSRVQSITNPSDGENFGISVKRGDTFFELFENGLSINASQQVMDYGLLDKKLEIKGSQFIPIQDTGDGTVILTLDSILDAETGDFNAKQPLTKNVLFVRNSPDSAIEVSAEMDSGLFFEEDLDPETTQDNQDRTRQIANLVSTGDSSVVNASENPDFPLSNQTYNSNSKFSEFVGYSFRFLIYKDGLSYPHYVMPIIKFRLPDISDARHPASKVYIGINPDLFVRLEPHALGTDQGDMSTMNGIWTINIGMNGSKRIFSGAQHGQINFTNESEKILDHEEFSGQEFEKMHFGGEGASNYSSSPITYVGWINPEQIINANGDLVSQVGSSFESVDLNSWWTNTSAIASDGGTLGYPNVDEAVLESLNEEVPLSKITYEITNFRLNFNLLLKDAIQSDFYANISGRNLSNLGAEGWSNPTYQNPLWQIIDLFVSELGLEHNLQYQTASEENNWVGSLGGDSFLDISTLRQSLGDLESDFKYDFSLIESKPFMDIINSMIRYLPIISHFNYEGKLKFNVIRKSYFEEDYRLAKSIKNDEIIKYKFRRTNTENIATKIVIKYNYDYSDKSLKDIYTKNLDANYLADYYNYYNIPSDHSETTLEIEVPFIKRYPDNSPLEALSKWILGWHSNDHIIVDLKLPLSYMELECGDLIKFDELPDGVKPFGINITTIQIPNYVYRYPLFMIFDIKINSSQVMIKAIQLNDLVSQDTKLARWSNFWLGTQQQEVDEDIEDPVENIIYGCTDPAYSEYYANSNSICVDDLDNCVDNGSCNDLAVFGCTDINATNYNPSSNVSDNDLCEYETEAFLSDRPKLRISMFFKNLMNTNQNLNITYDQLNSSLSNGIHRLLYSSRYEISDGVFDEEYFIDQQDTNATMLHLFNDLLSEVWRKPVFEGTSLYRNLTMAYFTVASSHAGSDVYIDAGEISYSGYEGNYETWNGLSNVQLSAYIEDDWVNWEEENDHDVSPIYFFWRKYLNNAPDISEENYALLAGVSSDFGGGTSESSPVSLLDIEEDENGVSSLEWSKQKLKWLMGKTITTYSDNPENPLIIDNGSPTQEQIQDQNLYNMKFANKISDLSYNWGVSAYNIQGNLSSDDFRSGWGINLDLLAVYMWYRRGYKYAYTNAYVNPDEADDWLGVTTATYPFFMIRVHKDDYDTTNGKGHKVRVGSYIWDSSDYPNQDILNNVSLQEHITIPMPFPHYLTNQLPNFDISTFGFDVVDCSNSNMDINDDGITNILDVVQTIQYILGELDFSDYQKCVADVNQDGIVNILDVILVIQNILD